MFLIIRFIDIDWCIVLLNIISIALIKNENIFYLSQIIEYNMRILT